ncbi:MAG: hypothetical protein R3B57_12950 [Phycisphaerales bacterium]
MKRGLLILCVVAAAVAVVVVSLWRSRVVNLPGQRTARQVELDEIRDATSNTQRALAKLRYVPRGEITTPDELEELLAPMIDARLASIADTSAPFAPDQVERIRDETIALFAARWLQSSPEAYVASRLDHGYELASLEGMKNWAIEAAYEAAVGEPLPESATAEEAFAAVWSRPARARLNMFSLRGVVASPEGVEVARGRFCPGDHQRWPSLDGALGAGVWEGPGGVGYTNLFAPPGGNWEGRRRENDCFETVTLGVALEFDGGVRVPLHLHYWFDDRAGRWWLGQVTSVNTPEGFGGVLF